MVGADPGGEQAVSHLALLVELLDCRQCCCILGGLLVLVVVPLHHGCLGSTRRQIDGGPEGSLPSNCLVPGLRDVQTAGDIWEGGSATRDSGQVQCNGDQA